MRFAVSAVAAVSGLFLLGLAFYGEPAVYLRKAREQWNALLDRPADDRLAGSPSPSASDPEAERAARLQQEIGRLREELAARQQAVPLPPIQAVAPPPVTPPPVAPPPAPAEPALTAAPMIAQPAPPAPVPREQPPPPRAMEVPERHVAAAEPPPVKVEPPRTPPPPARPAVTQHPIPAPPALPQPSPAQEADDTQSVLARLRQGAPSGPADNQTGREMQPPAPSPSLPRLLAARAALSSGRVDDARRLLQEAQLQLVFRPIAPDGDPIPAAGRGAANVAHALDALSANDIGMSQRYIAVALDDLSGKQTNPPIQQSDRRGSGYAPAYPPR